MSARPEITSRNTGFTLVEMLVIMVLIGLLLGLALPRFGGLGETEKLRAATRLLVGQILEAHSQSVTGARPYYLCLDLEGARIWLALKRAEKTEEISPEISSVTLPSGTGFKDVIHSNGGMFKEGVVTFAFWPNGGNEPGTIHLENNSGEEMTIFLRPFLGQTEIHQGYLREEVE